MVQESIFHSFTKLAFSDDFENPGRLPVSQVLEGTDDWVLRIFVIFLFSYLFFSQFPQVIISLSLTTSPVVPSSICRTGS